MSDQVRIVGVSRAYGSVRALRDISLSVRTGELFGFIGADGAGKTTLLRILVTLLLPDSGSVEVFGLDALKAWRQIRPRIGYMPGRFSLYPDLSVEENLRFFATVFGTTMTEHYDLIKDIYRQLEPFRTRRAGQLSGGMKQKLALSCALIHRPDLLVLDEPTTGVDAVSRKEFWAVLDRLRRDGMTILCSTPYMDEALRCDRIAFMQEGSVLALDTPDGIRRMFRAPLFAVRSQRTWDLLCHLRASRHAASVYAFGSAVHYSDRRSDITVELLQSELLQGGFGDLELEQVEPGIEDACILLMEEKNEQTHG